MYTIKCKREACNTDIDVLARGIADQEIQLELLGDQNQDMSLEDMLQFVEAKESGKRSASRLLDPPSVSATSSSYRRSKQHEMKGKQPDISDRTPVICSYCGAKAMAVEHRFTPGGKNVQHMTTHTHTVVRSTTLKTFISVRITQNHLAIGGFGKTWASNYGQAQSH